MDEMTQGRRAFLASLGALSTVGLAPNRTETSLVVAQSNLRIEPIAHLEQDRVQWPRIKQILNVTIAVASRCAGAQGGPSMGGYSGLQKSPGKALQTLAFHV